MIKAKCPKCRKLMALDEDQEGQLVMCPHCDAKFRVPAAPKDQPRPAKAAAPKPVDAPIPLKPVEPTPSVDPDFAPYVFKDEIDRKPVEGEEDMVKRLAKEHKIKKERQRAWDLVGPPSKFIKILVLVLLVIELICLGYLFTELTLYNHALDMREREKQEEIDKAAKAAKDRSDLFETAAKALYVGRNFPTTPPPRLKEQEEPKYIWLMDSFRIKRYTPAAVCMILIGMLLLRLAVAIGVLGGIEKMKTLESYPWAMTGAIILIIGFGVFGIINAILFLSAEEPDFLDVLLGTISVALYGLAGIGLGAWAIFTCNNPQVRNEWENRKKPKGEDGEETEDEDQDDDEDEGDADEDDSAADDEEEEDD